MSRNALWLLLFLSSNAMEATSDGYVMRCCSAICFFNSVVMAIKTKRYRYDTCAMRCDQAMLTEHSKWWVIAIYIKYQIAIEHWFCCMTTVQCNLVTVAISWHNLTQHEKTFLYKVQAWSFQCHINVIMSRKLFCIVRDTTVSTRCLNPEFLSLT